MDVSAEADAFLQGLQAEVEPSNAQQPAEEPSAADLIAQAQAAAASLNATVGTQPAAQQQADGVFANGSAPAHEEETTRQKKRRNRWGNPAADVSDAAPAQALPSPAAPVAAFTPTPEPEPKKKRRSRWEDTDASDETAIAQIKPKELVLPGGIKVALPSTLLGVTHDNPKIRALHEKLADITRRIATNDLQIPPEGQRSPSPQPIYDRNGQRLNTREVRTKDKMADQRSHFIEELLRADPAYRPPPDWRPAKKYRKIFIPQKDYPGYNFIGLIIGPRGNTQKRMQKETNTKIAIRGRGSVKEGAARDPKYDYGEDEELHVLITADNQKDADDAAKMIEELLVPTDEARNEHKRLQLRELAALNGTLKDDEHCYLCGQGGHRQFECPNQQQEVFKLPEVIQSKANEQYERDVARMAGERPVAGKGDAEYNSFLQEMGVGPSPSAGGPGGPGGHGGGGYGGDRHRPGLGAGPPGQRMRPGDELPDDCKLYVAGLQPHISDEMLRDMIKPFGAVLHGVVLKDINTYESRGFGFVHLDNPHSAAAAKGALDGKLVDGKPMIVKLRSERGQPGSGPRPPFMQAGGEPDDSKLYVAHLPPTMDDDNLRRLFSTYGVVLSTRVINDRDTGVSRGYGFVNMADVPSAQAAMRSLDNYKVGDRVLSVKVAGKKEGMANPGGPVPRPGGPSIMSPAPRPGGPAPGYPPYPGGPASGPPPPYGHPAYRPPGAPAPYPGAPAPYPGAPPPGYYPPGSRPPYPGAQPPPGYHPPPGYSAPPPGYAPPPAGYAPPAGYPPHPGHYPPPAGHAYAPTSQYPPASGYPAPAHGQPAGQHSQQPPLPNPDQPPLPSDAPPLPQDDKNVQSEYERFLAEMQSGLPGKR